MGPKCQSNPAPAPRQPLPARTVNGSERKLKISCKSMGEESPRNVSLHDCHCRGGAWRRSGLRGQGEGRDQDGEAAPSGLLSLTLTSGPSLDPLVATSLCFQNPSISSPHHLELPPPSPPWGPCFCLCNSDRVPCFAQNAPPSLPAEFPPRPEKNPTSSRAGSHRPSATSSPGPTRRPHSTSATLSPLLLPKRPARCRPRAFASAVSPARNTFSAHLLQGPRCAQFKHHLLGGLPEHPGYSRSPPTRTSLLVTLFYILHISIQNHPIYVSLTACPTPTPAKT